MASIDERNETNRLAGIEAQLGDIKDELQLQRVQQIGLASMMVILAYGLYKVGKLIVQ